MANNKVQLPDGTVLIDLTSDTVTNASHIKSGLVGHLADGTTATGTLVEKDVKSVTYNLSGGATASIFTSEVVTGQGFSVKLKAPAGYNLSNVSVTMGGVDITSQVFEYDEGGGGGTPSATQHTIYFEFSDNTNTTINAWYNDSFISDAITATTPSTYGQKTVDSASLDGVTWYTRPTETWETLYDQSSVLFVEESDPNDPPYCWLSTLADVTITIGSVWRVTFDGTEYRLTCTQLWDNDHNGVIGNPLYTQVKQDDGSGIPFGLYSTDWGAWSGAADVVPNTTHSVKIERLVTS